MSVIHHPNVVTDGLIACWDAANRVSYPGAGTVWTDLAGGYSATLTNFEAGFFDSAKGGSFNFDGTDAYIVTAAPSPSGTGGFAVGFWVKFDSFPTRSPAIIANYVINECQILFGETDNYITAGIAGTWNLINVPLTEATDTWYYFVFTRLDGVVKLYSDGVEIGSASNTDDIESSGNTYFGIQASSSSPGVGWDHAMDGNMAVASIYNKGLTAAEVLQNYEAMKPRFTPRITKSGLVGNWDAGDPQSYNGGTIWKDTANHNSVTLENSSTGFDFNPANGGFFEFDGTDDYCSGGPVPPSGDSTYGAWCYFSDDNWEPIFNSSDSTLYLWFGRRGGGEWLGELFLHYHNTNNNTSHYTVTSNTLSLNTWYYITATWNGSAITLYINGASQSATTTGTPTNITNASGIWFGRVFSDYLNGRMSVLQIYNKALSAAEIMDNYNATKGRFT